MEVAFRVLFSLVMGRISKRDSDIAFIEEMGKSHMISKKMSGDFFARVWGVMPFSYSILRKALERKWSFQGVSVQESSLFLICFRYSKDP